MTGLPMVSTTPWKIDHVFILEAGHMGCFILFYFCACLNFSIENKWVFFFMLLITTHL